MITVQLFYRGILERYAVTLVFLSETASHFLNRLLRSRISTACYFRGLFRKYIQSYTRKRFFEHDAQKSLSKHSNFAKGNTKRIVRINFIDVQIEG